MQAEGKEERTRLERKWLQAAPTDRTAVMAEIRQFNHAHPEARLTQSDLIRQMVAQRKQAAGPAGLYGLRVPTKGRAAGIEAGGFANTQ
jgi:hypothetical protein